MLKEESTYREDPKTVVLTISSSSQEQRKINVILSTAHKCRKLNMNAQCLPGIYFTGENIN